jgi:hypothetical protein
MKVYVLRLVVWLPNEVTKAYKTIFAPNNIYYFF